MALSTGGIAQFVPGSVRIVDYDSTNNNVLIRGSSAFGTTVDGTSTMFTMANMISAIQADANFSELPASIQTNLNSTTPAVIDFCLIGFGSHKDEKLVTSEVQYFAPNAAIPDGTPPATANYYPYYINSTTGADSPGVVAYWPVQSFGVSQAICSAGDTWGTGIYPDLSILSTCQGQNGWNFAGLVPAVRAALTNQISALPSGGNGAFPSGVTTIQNSIIYVHCDSGVNRTGAVIASYLMQYGSNLTALGIASSPAAPYPLATAQVAANLAPPSNDTSPAGGNDLIVAIAYCNYVNCTTTPKTANYALASAAVAAACPYCPSN